MALLGSVKVNAGCKPDEFVDTGDPKRNTCASGARGRLFGYLKVKTFGERVLSVVPDARKANIREQREHLEERVILFKANAHQAFCNMCSWSYNRYSHQN